MRRKLFGSTIVIALLVAMAQPAAAAIQKVRDTTAREYGFSIDRNAGGDVIRTWAQDSAQHPNRFQIWWQAQGDPAQRLTGPGAHAGAGSVDIDNSRGALVSYNVFTPSNGYDVKLYDLEGAHPVPVPDGVNTKAQETRPIISGDYLLFQRGSLREGSRRVILFNLLTEEVERVLAVAHDNGIVFGDQVNGDYAVYMICPPNDHCFIRRYQISTQTKTPPLPNGGRAAYGSTVDDDGNVYYVIGHPARCGVNTQIHRWSGGTTAPKIEQFPNGIEVDFTWAYERPDTSIAVYFTRVVCLPGGNVRSGIYVTDG